MLHGLAIDVSKEPVQNNEEPAPMFSDAEIEESTYHANNASEGRTAWQDHIDEKAKASEVFASPKTGSALTVTDTNSSTGKLVRVDVSGPGVFADPKAAGAPVAEVPQATKSTQPHVIDATETTPENVDSAKEAGAVLSGVELADGLPWDHRIHGGGRTKLAKAPHGWKRKRGIDPDFIIEVEAELRAAMAVGTAPAPAPVPSSTSEPQALPVDFTKLSPAPAPAPAPAEITNFAALMAACTAKGLTSEQVLAAVNAIGLGSIPLLAARPDLIPAVAHNLGL
jgi:hypothetical protein